MSLSYGYSGTDWGGAGGWDQESYEGVPGIGGDSGELPGFLKGVKFLTDFTEKNFGTGGKYSNLAQERAQKRRSGQAFNPQLFDNFAYIPSPLASQFGGMGGMTVSGGGPSTTQQIGGAALSAGKGALSGFAAGGPIGALAGAAIGGLGGLFG